MRVQPRTLLPKSNVLTVDSVTATMAVNSLIMSIYLNMLCSLTKHISTNMQVSAQGDAKCWEHQQSAVPKPRGDLLTMVATMKEHEAAAHTAVTEAILS